MSTPLPDPADAFDESEGPDLDDEFANFQTTGSNISSNVASKPATNIAPVKQTTPNQSPASQQYQKTQTQVKNFRPLNIGNSGNAPTKQLGQGYNKRNGKPAPGPANPFVSKATTNIAPAATGRKHGSFNQNPVQQSSNTSQPAQQQPAPKPLNAPIGNSGLQNQQATNPVSQSQSPQQTAPQIGTATQQTWPNPTVSPQQQPQGQAQPRQRGQRRGQNSNQNLGYDPNMRAQAQQVMGNTTATYPQQVTTVVDPDPATASTGVTATASSNQNLPAQQPQQIQPAQAPKKKGKFTLFFVIVIIVLLILALLFLGLTVIRQQNLLQNQPESSSQALATGVANNVTSTAFANNTTATVSAKSSAEAKSGTPTPTLPSETATAGAKITATAEVKATAIFQASSGTPTPTSAPIIATAMAQATSTAKSASCNVNIFHGRPIQIVSSDGTVIITGKINNREYSQIVEIIPDRSDTNSDRTTFVLTKTGNVYTGTYKGKDFIPLTTVNGGPVLSDCSLMPTEGFILIKPL